MDVSGERLRGTCGELTRQISMLPARRAEIPSWTARWITPWLGSLFKGGMVGLITMAMSGCVLAIFIQKEVQYYEGYKVVYPPPQYPPLFDNLWMGSVALFIAVMLLTQVFKLREDRKQARWDKAHGDLVYQCLTRILPYAAPDQIATYWSSPDGRQRLNVPMQWGAPLELIFQDKGDRIEVEAVVETPQPVTLAALKTIGQHTPEPPTGVRLDQGKKVHLEGSITRTSLGDRLASAEPQGAEDGRDVAMEVATWVQELLALSGGKAAHTEAGEEPGVVLRRSGAAALPVSLGDDWSASLEAGVVDGGPGVGAWMMSRMSPTGTLWSTGLLAAAIAVIGMLLVGLTTASLTGLFAVGVVAGAVLAYSLGHIDLSSRSTPLTPRVGASERIHLDRTRLHLGHRHIQLEEPFQLRLTRSSGDTGRHTLGVELIQTSDDAGEPTRLRFLVPLAPGSADGLPVYDLVAPVVAPEVFRDRVWPAVRHAAAMHGADPGWAIEGATAEVKSREEVKEEVTARS